MAFSGRREQVAGAVAAAGVTGALGLVLLFGLAVRGGMAPEQATLTLLNVPPPVLQQRVERMPQRDTRPSGASAPPNLTARATEVAAPIPVVVVPIPPVMPVAERPTDGAQVSSGAAPVPGPGFGAGGAGDGFGGGGRGDGAGAGDRDPVPPRQIAGRIRDADYPDDLADAGQGGRVTVLYQVDRSGRVAECEVVRSSGIARLDAFTCRLIRERFRFRPARDEWGKPESVYIEQTHDWSFERLPHAK